MKRVAGTARCVAAKKRLKYEFREDNPRCELLADQLAYRLRASWCWSEYLALRACVLSILDCEN